MPMMSNRVGGRRPAGPVSAARWLWLLLLLPLLGSGCQQAPGADAAPATATATFTATATAAAASTQRPPVVVAVEPTATDLPSFALQSAEDLLPPAAEMTPTGTATPTVAAGAMAAAETVTTTATAGPTFTPPAAPEAPAGEHYWFNRPVAQGGTVWTDKHYPYGSTLGGQLRTHHGVEFNVGYNTEILAVAPGTVVVAGNDTEVAYGPHLNFYGNLVVIRHDLQQNGQPVFSLYGHLNEVLVSEGQAVAGREVIGLSGATGVADGPHVHLEVRVGENGYGNTRNPLLWLYPFSGRGTVAGRVVWPDGQPATGVPVSLNRVDGEAPYSATTTYADTSVNPDPTLNENFAIDDVVAGYYQVIVSTGSKKHRVETWVYPGRTSFVEIVLE